MEKIVVVGCGNVGMAYIFALMNQNTHVDEIVMIDVNEERIEGELMDLCHTLNYAPNNLKLKVGDYSDCHDADIVCITAGIPQTMNDRLKDLEKNNILFKEIVAKVMDSGFDGIFLVASNPLDVMTYLTQYYSGLPYNRVIGSGTSLDSSRLSYLISEKLDISPKSVHAYVIGEHGNSQFAFWSKANIAMQEITKFLSLEEMDRMEEEVRTAAYEIMERKGSTYYGIAICLARITEAILSDEEFIMPVSNYDKNNDVYISTPCVLGKEGIKERIYLDLNAEETVKMENSIRIIKEAITKIL